MQFAKGKKKKNQVIDKMRLQYIYDNLIYTQLSIKCRNMQVVGRKIEINLS